MTTTFPAESKCPKCGKLYTYFKVTSMFVTKDNHDFLKSLLDYTKECECGETFDMSKNETKNVGEFSVENLSDKQKESMEYVRDFLNKCGLIKKDNETEIL
jgi:hypothetical protein